MALETPSRPPPPFMANAILNFHFDFLHPSLMQIKPTSHHRGYGSENNHAIKIKPTTLWILVKLTR